MTIRLGLMAIASVFPLRSLVAAEAERIRGRGLGVLLRVRCGAHVLRRVTRFCYWIWWNLYVKLTKSGHST